MKLILTCDYGFDDPVWQGISPQAEDFISKLIEPNVKRRLTCEQALAHPWIKQNKPAVSMEHQKEIAEIFLRLKSIRKMSRFAQAMHSIFMRLLDEESLVMNLMAFHMIDEDNSGQLDATEMQVAMERLRATMPELAFTDEDVEATFDKLDVDKSGLITFS